MDRRYSMYFQILCCQRQCYDILCHFFFERVATPHFLPFLREQRLKSLKFCREGLHFHPPSSLFLGPFGTTRSDVWVEIGLGGSIFKEIYVFGDIGLTSGEKLEF